MSGKQRLGLVLAAIAVAVVAVIVIVSSSDNSKKKSTTSAAQTTGTGTGATKTPPAQPKVERITIKNGTADGGIQSFSVTQGDQANIVVDTDQPHPIHIHGYDILKQAAPGKPAEFKFKADRTGVYEMEIEDTSTQIGKLTVEQ